MGENKIYDTSIIIELVRRKATRKVPYVSVITVIEYPPAVEYAEKILYPTRRDYHLAITWQSELRALENPLPATDLIIVAQAVNNNVALVTRDMHFKILKETVTSNLQLEVV